MLRSRRGRLNGSLAVRIALLGLATAVLLGLSVSFAQAVGTGHIDGSASFAGSGPAEGVEVTLYRWASGESVWSPERAVRTGPDGSYTFGALEPGTYRVRFGATSSSVAVWYPDSPSPDGAESFVIDAEYGGYSGIHQVLRQGGRIAGRVVSDDGTPVSGLVVVAHREEADGSWEGHATTTGANGEYEIGDLDSGAYKVEFEASFATVGEWWNDVETSERATPIALAVGEARSGVDAVVARGARIAGRVRFPAGVPFSEVDVRALREEPDGDWHQVAWCATGTDGSYVLVGLPEGTYTVAFDGGGGTAWQYWGGVYDRNEARTFSVVPGQLKSGIDALLTREAKVLGRVVDVAGGPIAGCYVYAERIVGAGERSWDGASTIADADGKFAITGLAPGSYRIEFEPDSAHVGEYWDNQPQEASATVVALAEGATRTGIDAVLATAGYIEGRVSDAAGRPVKDVWVNVSLESTRTNLFFNNCAATGEDGRYSVGGLMPGTYSVTFAAPNDFVTETWNNRGFGESPNLVVVDDGRRVTGIDAQLATAAHIRGRVVDANGDPIVGVEVSPSCRDESTGQLTWSQSGVRTDYNGTYDLGGLPPGNYVVDFGADWNTQTPEWALEYWDDALSWQSADAIALSPGQVRSGVNVVLERAARLQGTARLSTGAPAVRVTVFAQRRSSSGDWETIRSTSTGASGAYVLGGLPSGTYRVEFASSADVFGRFYSGVGGSGAETIGLSPGQTRANLDVTLKKRARAALTRPTVSRAKSKVVVSGRVIPAHTAAVVVAVERRVDGAYRTHKLVAVTATKKGSYRLSVSLPAGTYRFRASHNDAAHWPVSSAYSAVVVVK